MTARFCIDDMDQDEQRHRRFYAIVDNNGRAHAVSAAVHAAFHTAITGQAARTARYMIKRRARAYLADPWQLAVLGDDLPGLPPQHLVTALAYIARNLPTYRWCGNGGEIPALNLKAAMLCARFRRFHRIRARRAACPRR